MYVKYTFVNYTWDYTGWLRGVQKDFLKGTNDSKKWAEGQLNGVEKCYPISRWSKMDSGQRIRKGLN